MIYDPERLLWRPGRRSFLFMFGAAVVAPSLPDLPDASLRTITTDAIIPIDFEVGDVLYLSYDEAMRITAITRNGFSVIRGQIDTGLPPIASGRRQPSPHEGTAPTGLPWSGFHPTPLPERLGSP